MSTENLVEGWGVIAARVSIQSGLDVSASSVMRWAQRVEDPLPVRRWGGRRPRVVANVNELDLWVERQWKATP